MTAPDDDWRLDARCANSDPESWFPEEGAIPRAALAACGRCLVADPCRQYAIDNHLDWGVWGGTTGAERKRMRRAG